MRPNLLRCKYFFNIFPQIRASIVGDGQNTDPESMDYPDELPLQNPMVTVRVRVSPSR